ncbi:ubiquitin carboxyl-terminal hydrolase 12-like protein isoform X2 [Tanacetum coccineum]
MSPRVGNAREQDKFLPNKTGPRSPGILLTKEYKSIYVCPKETWIISYVCSIHKEEIAAQCALEERKVVEHPTVDANYEYGIELVVCFRSLDNPKEDSSFQELSKHNNHNDIAERVACYLNLDDRTTIRRTSHNCYSQQPKLQSIRFLKVDHLLDMLTHYNEVSFFRLNMISNATSNILYYEVMDMPLPESHATND